MSLRETEQCRLPAVYLNVCSTLVLNIVCNGVFVAMLANGVYIIPLRPELPTPQLLLHLGVRGEDHFGRDAFDRLHYSRGSEVRHCLDEKMDMIFVRTHLVEPNFVPLLDAEAHVFQRHFDFACEHVPAVLGRTDQVVQEERFVMTLQDVFAHSPILAQNAPAAELRGNLFEYN